MEWNVDLLATVPTGVVAGTLLGPEGSVDPSSGLLAPDHQPISWQAASHEVDSRSSLENCTVDASIKIKVFVVKLLRAFGGCLGIRSR